MTAPAPPPARHPWSPRLVLWAGLGLELSVLLFMVGMASLGFAGEEFEAGRLPVPLEVRDLFPLLLVGLHAVWRLRGWEARVWNRTVSPFPVSSALVMGLALAVHPQDGMSPAQSGGMGLLVGGIFGVLGVPVHDIAEPLTEGSTSQPTRQLLVAATLVLLGILGSAVQGGVLVAAPTMALGIALLGRTVVEEAQSFRRGSFLAAMARLVLALGLLPLGLGLLLMVVLMGLRPLGYG